MFCAFDPLKQNLNVILRVPCLLQEILYVPFLKVNDEGNKISSLTLRDLLINVGQYIWSVNAA